MNLVIEIRLFSILLCIHVWTILYYIWLMIWHEIWLIKYYHFNSIMCYGQSSHASMYNPPLVGVWQYDMLVVYGDGVPMKFIDLTIKEDGTSRRLWWCCCPWMKMYKQIWNAWNFVCHHVFIKCHFGALDFLNDKSIIIVKS